MIADARRICLATFRRRPEVIRDVLLHEAVHAALVCRREQNPKVGDWEEWTCLVCEDIVPALFADNRWFWRLF